MLFVQRPQQREGQKEPPRCTSLKACFSSIKAAAQRWMQGWSAKESVWLMPEEDYAAFMDLRNAAGGLHKATAETFDEHVARRCQGTAGDWCGLYVRQTLIPYKVEPFYTYTTQGRALMPSHPTSYSPYALIFYQVQRLYLTQVQPKWGQNLRCWHDCTALGSNENFRYHTKGRAQANLSRVRVMSWSLLRP